jgi:hypothetical protein
VRDGTRADTRRARVRDKRVRLHGACAARSAAPLRGCMLRACMRRPGPAAVRCGRASRLRWPAQRAVRARRHCNPSVLRCGAARRGAGAERRMSARTRQRAATAPGGRARLARGHLLLPRRRCERRVAAVCDAAPSANAAARPFSAPTLRADACNAPVLLPRRRRRGGGLPARRADARSVRDARLATATAHAKACHCRCRSAAARSRLVSASPARHKKKMARTRGARRLSRHVILTRRSSPAPATCFSFVKRAAA